MVEKSENKDKLTIGEIFLVVILVLSLVLLIGFIIDWYETKNEKNTEKDNEIQKTELEKKEKRLIEVKKEIAKLKPKKQILYRKQQKLFIIARLTIGAFLLILNGLYLYFDNLCPFDLGKQLNINGGILLVYSFIGFLSFGSPDKLLKKLKKIVTKNLRKQRIHILTELNQLEKEEKDILAFINKQK